MTTDSGRRRAPRVKARLKVRFKDAGAFISEYTHNISKGGIFVRTKKPCEVDSTVEVVLVMPESNDEIVAVGKVIHAVDPGQATASQPSGMGIELKQLPDKDRERIEDFIQQKSKAGEIRDGLGRRKHERFETKIRVRFGSLEALMDEYSHNISHGGIYIRTTRPQKLGEKLRIILTHPLTSDELNMEGEVVRIVEEIEANRTNQPPGMGIRFLDLDRHARAQLTSFIDSTRHHPEKKMKIEQKKPAPIPRKTKSSP